MFSISRSAFSLLLKLQLELLLKLQLKSLLKSRLLLLVFIVHTMAFSHAAFAGPLIDINTANASVLAGTLPGIGPSKAKAIVDYRDLNGPYQSVDELINVKGIGEVTLNRIKPFLFKVGQGSEQSRLYPSVSSRVQVLLNASGQSAVDDALPDAPNESELQARRAIRAALNLALRNAEQNTQP